MSKARSASLAQTLSHQGLPIAVVLGVVLFAWYALAVALNAQGAIERDLADTQWRWSDLVATTWAMQRPVLPAPHQVALDLWSSMTDWPLSSPRNLLFHMAVTAQSTLVGFVMGTVLGLVLSIAIIRARWIARYCHGSSCPSRCRCWRSRRSCW